MKKAILPSITVVIAVLALFAWWMGGAQFVVQLTGSAVTPTNTASPRLTVVEGGIVQIGLDDYTLLLDQRAAPYYTVKLGENVEMLGGDKKPLSLFDLRSGDVVRVEGQATDGTTFLAMRLVRAQAVARVIATATPSPVPRETPTTTPTPLISNGDRVPLPGHLLIADSGNHRIIQVTPDKKIAWELPTAQSPDDAFFTPGYKSVLTIHSRDHAIVEIDIATRNIIWSFGEWGVAGSDNRHLNTPVDAARLADGRTLVAEIRNCRIAIISKEKGIIGQVGKTGQCKTDKGHLSRPNGIALLPNGRVLVAEAGARRVGEMDLKGNVYRSLAFPNIAYPSDAQLTQQGNVLVAAYEKPGRIVEINWSGDIVWEYFPKNPGEQLDRPSRALELPNGNIAFADDYNHRVVVVNRAGKLLWQYGVTGVPGTAPGYLNVPMGLDFRPVGVQ